MKNTKTLKSKWIMDKYWNISGGGHFFHVSDLLSTQLRAELDNTYTVTMLIGTHLIGMLFGKDKKMANAQFDFLNGCKKAYQEYGIKDHKEHHNVMEKMVKLQEKAIKHHE